MGAVGYRLVSLVLVAALAGCGTFLTRTPGFMKDAAEDGLHCPRVYAGTCLDWTAAKEGGDAGALLFWDLPLSLLADTLLLPLTIYEQLRYGSFGEKDGGKTARSVAPGGPRLRWGWSVRTSIPVDIEGDRVLVPARVSGQAVRLRLDPGAPRTVIGQQVLSRAGLAVPRDALRSVVADASGQMRARPLVAAAIQLGEMAVENVGVAVDEREGDGGVLAGDVLGLFTATLDRDERRLVLEPLP